MKFQPYEKVGPEKFKPWGGGGGGGITSLGVVYKTGHQIPLPLLIGVRHFTHLYGVLESFTNYSLYNKQKNCEASPIW